MSFERFKKTRARWNCFAKIDQLGAFDFCTSTISLDALKADDVAEITVAQLAENGDAPLDMASYARQKKVLPLAVHEYTHFCDATSTLWGLNHLCALDAAYSTPARPETEFYRLKVLFDRLRRLRLPTYYSTVNPNVAAARPWRWDLTGGREFTSDGHISDRPILFARFATADGDLIARSPISLLSLFETSAMAEEVHARSILINRLGPDERTVERRLFETETMSYIYNENLTEYSVCAHVVANMQGCKDVGLALSMSSFIAKFVLNAPNHAFEMAAKNLGDFKKRYGIKDDSADEIVLLTDALSHYNHGALFYLLTMLLPRNCSGSHKAFLEGFEEALRSLGIVRDEFEGIKADEAARLAATLEASALQTLQILGRSGYRNFQQLSAVTSNLPFENLDLPPAWLDDMSQYHFSPNAANELSAFDIEVNFNELIKGQIRMEQFGDACL